MSKGQLYIENLPDTLRERVDAKRAVARMTVREFVIDALERAVDDENGYKFDLFDQKPVPLRPATPDSLPFKFIDLFAGIGGLRLGLQLAGGRCVFSCEWEKNAQKTYHRWYGDTPKGDITKVLIPDIPKHDVLAAGFPCQPFSIAGVSKKNSLGKAHGFKCHTQGNLFFDLMKIVEIKRPPVLLLENVKNLKSHDKGNTWNVINGSLEDARYWVFSEVLDAADFGVPQHRERVFIVCFDKEEFPIRPPFLYPKPTHDTWTKLRDILEPNPDKRYTLTDHLWTYLQDYAQRHREKGNGFGFGLADLDGITRTLSARYYKDGSEVLVPQKRGNPRRLTPREAALLMGFSEDVAKRAGLPEHFPQVVSDTQAYRQFGNAVVPPVAEAVAREITRVLRWHIQTDESTSLFSRRAVATADAE